MSGIPPELLRYFTTKSFLKYMLSSTKPSLYEELIFPETEDWKQFLEGNEVFETLVDEGILFVAQMYQHNDLGLVTVGGISIEGIGVTPTKALVNFRFGLSENEIMILSDNADLYFNSDEFISNMKLPYQVPIGYSRTSEKDWGFFIKRDVETGKVILKGKFLAIPMNDLRLKADQVAGSYLALTRPSNKRLEALLESQEFLQKIRNDFMQKFVNDGVIEKLKSAEELRNSAIDRLKKADELFEKSAREARVASGMKLVADLTAIGAKIATSINDAQLRKEANDTLTKALNVAKSNAEQISDISSEINSLSNKIVEIQRKSVPNVPVFVFSLHTNISVIMRDAGIKYFEDLGLQ